MRLLFVTDVFPFPPHHGSAVISYHWMRLLASHHEITTLSIAPPESIGSAKELDKLGIRVRSPVLPILRTEVVWDLASRWPRPMRRLRVREVTTAIADAIGQDRADVILLVGPALGSILPARSWTAPTVFVPYDAESANVSMRIPFVRNPIRRLYFGLERRKWESAESRLYPLADACVAVTEDDAATIARGWSEDSRARMHVITNGVDVTQFFPNAGEEQNWHIVITGNMWSIESQVSVNWFLRQVLPLIRRELPQVTVDIVGRNPASSILRRSRDVGGVFVHGFVPDIRPYVRNASVYVAPLRLGSGVKNRVLEALAMGKAVVATPESVRGLRVVPGRDVIVAATEEAFAGAVVGLLKDEARRRSFGDAARRTVVDMHAWESVAPHLWMLLRQVTGSGGGEPARILEGMPSVHGGVAPVVHTQDGERA